MNDDLLKRMRVRAEFTGPYSALWDEAADRIEKLEEALRLIIEHPVEISQQWQVGCNEMQKVARKALEVEGHVC